MRTILSALLLLTAPVFAWASGGAHLEHAHIDLTDQASLQRGVKYFVNYCMGCHELRYVRYSRMAEDLGIPEIVLRKTLIFDPETKPGDLMTNALRAEDGVKWFGTAIPDLTLVTRWRSPDWVYTYLKSFYLDDKRPYGVNNLVFPDVGMPHILAELQGIQKPVYDKPHSGQEPKVIGVKLVQAGQLTPEQYDELVRDLTNFLTYVGEPIKLERQRLGIYVLLFLGVMFILAYQLKKEYWRDVH